MKNGINSSITLSSLIIALGSWSGAAQADNNLSALSLTNPSGTSKFDLQPFELKDAHENSDTDSGNGEHAHHHDNTEIPKLTKVDANNTFII